MKQKFAKDFIAGGAVVSFALWLASIVGPVIGGIFAGLPIRLAATIAFERNKGAEYIERMAKGALLGFIANFSFIFTLIFCLNTLTLYHAFITASTVCLTAIAIIRQINKTSPPNTQ
ncbi:MAG: hypothetical protein DRN71_03335 [Candidatus Nanohalarchaeota archaeon]|nr:MAG: hypothetical protein DRN71_03335 [Candidatus Nanohaloarchaeota archaeon]